VRTALSGPAGGVAGAFALAQAAGFERIVTLDMGGTSTDVSLCPGRVLERDEALVGELPIRGPTVDVMSVGAGGGSIARIDEGGALRVGPESAGADPGPACYGRGQAPTVTDAHVVLGRITPEHFLGGRMTLDAQRSEAALRRIAAPFNGDHMRAAVAVLRVANANMERALRVVSVERGYDPRDFTLTAFGGAGPLHACDLAESLRIGRVLIPRYPGVLSALGMAHAPVVKHASAAVFAAPGTGRGTRGRLEALRTRLTRKCESELQREGFAVRDAVPETAVDMRYAGQSYELPVAAPVLDPVALLADFHAAHLARWGHADQGRAVEIVNLRVRVTLPGSGYSAAAKGAVRGRAAKPSAESRTWFNGRAAAVKARIFERERLGPGDTFRGPALVVQMDSTTVINPGWRGMVDAGQNLLLEAAASRRDRAR
jgi:N-methylhydantoinase A